MSSSAFPDHIKIYGLCFQEGANSAFQEAVGDAVMYGVMAPQHLQRLGFINDTSQGNFIQFNLISTPLWHFDLTFFYVNILYVASVCMLHVNLFQSCDFFIFQTNNRLYWFKTLKFLITLFYSLLC